MLLSAVMLRAFDRFRLATGSHLRTTATHHVRALPKAVRARFALGNLLAILFQACASSAPLPAPATGSCAGPACAPATPSGSDAAGSADSTTPSASATRTDSSPPGAPPVPERVLAPIYSPELLVLRAKAQRRILVGDVPLIEDEQGKTVEPASSTGLATPLLANVTPTEKSASANEPFSRQNGNALGKFVPVENEAALAHFHAALEALAAGRDADGKLRIAIYGASHTQGDLYTGYLRYYLQSRFGNGGAGFMQLAKLNAFYRTLDFKVDSDGFRSEFAQRKDAPEQGRYGLLGAAAVGRFPYAYARVTPANPADSQMAAERFELYFDKEPGGGDLKLKVDGIGNERLTGSAEQPSAGYFAFERSLGAHQIEVRPAGNGPIRLFGLSIERSAPGIVVDSMGINGTRAANMLRWDEPLWAEHLARRAPELAIVSYGTNEVTDTGEPIANYASHLRQVLGRLRKALPTQSCLLMGPGDFPKAQGEAWVERPRLREIIAAQRAIAPEFGCGFWDTYAFMGGEGAMQRWVQARPALGSPDHIHFTARGYVRMGMAFADALLRAYDETHQPLRATPPPLPLAPSPPPTLVSIR